jgi:outer membrane protein TolC
MRNTYMVEGSMSLPWLDRRKHDAEVATAAAAVSEQDAELAALRTRAFGQIKESLAEAEAAQKFAALYQNSLRPQAEATLHAAVIAYENNQADFLDLLDSQMQVIYIDVAWLQALADFNSRLADLEMAVGAPISIDATTATPSTQEENQ